MPTTENISLEFGGPLTGLPYAPALLLLGLLFFIGVGIVWWSYQNTLASLTKGHRCTLICLRVLLLLTLILCLTNPTKIQRTFLSEKEQPSAILLVDHSSSMTTEDNRGKTRLDAAVRTWRSFEEMAENHFADIRTFHFDKEVRGARGERIYPDLLPGEESTRLLKALQTLLEEEAPDAVFVMTDGLDTEQENRENHLAAIRESSIPISFVVGENRVLRQREFSLKEFDVPGEILRDTSFPVQCVISAHLVEKKRLPVRLEVDGEEVMSLNVELEEGDHLLPLQENIASGSPGERVLTLIMGKGEEERTFRRVVSVVEQGNSRVLYYQGTPDWGFRFTKKIFSREPSIELTSIFKPVDEVTVTSGQEELEELPDLPRSLDGFDVVLLSQVPYRQLTPTRQAALMEYVRQGGGLLLLVSDDRQARMLKRTDLEAILPVVLPEPSNRVVPKKSLRDQMGELRDPQRASGVRLHPFAISEDSPYAYIFRNQEKKKTVVPKFSTTAKIYSLKPGAHALAYHPTDRDAQGERGILLAMQRFGEGRSAVLATDSLWRWKLSTKSDSDGPELFWQQLLHSIAGPSNTAIHFVRPPLEVSVDSPLTLNLANASGLRGLLEVTAISPGQERVPLIPLAGDRPDRRKINWTPTEVGEWAIVAKEGERMSCQMITVSPPPRTKPDRAHESADVELLRTLASATGGEMLEAGRDPQWLVLKNPNDDLISERRTPLWSIWPVFWVAVALYSTELILRRRWKLL